MALPCVSDIDQGYSCYLKSHQDFLRVSFRSPQINRNALRQKPQGENCSAVPPEFPCGHSNCCNGQTRTSLLKFRKPAPGRQFQPIRMPSHQPDTLCNEIRKENSPSAHLSCLKYHIFMCLSTKNLSMLC